MVRPAILATITEQTGIGFYLTYALLSIVLVIWLARTLHQKGEIFLKDVFEEEDMAAAVNHLLVVGFYLLNMGYALLLYRLDAEYDSLTTAFNDLVSRLGLLVLSLGVIHLLNMFVFWRIRNHRNRRQTRQYVPAPVPTMNMPPVVGNDFTA